MFDSSLFVVSTNNATNAKAHGCNNGALMDRFGVLIQGLLAIVAFSTLMLKRFREPKGERRPWRIWFCDTSKQAIGALFIHFANVFLSNLAEEDPCSLYLMNFLLDASLGMLLIWAGVKAISCVVEYKQFTLLTFGEYGDPPQAAAWIGQCALYMLIMVFEKTVISLVLLIPGWTKVIKRFREPKGERRPWRIWFCDTSKQAIGALFIHFANVFLSNLAEEDPCSLYLMNFLLDATLGMLLIWAGVKAISCVVEYKQFTLLTFGEYGDPPQAAAWIGQCALYMLIMVFEKTVISLVLLIPGWTKVLLAAGNDTDPSESEHEGDVIQDPSKIKIMDSSYCQQV
ncbi:UNVERIFIED_CONTAM: hypothetical protein FKN15_035768 [Acipenser sinensis]